MRNQFLVNQKVVSEHKYSGTIVAIFKDFEHIPNDYIFDKKSWLKQQENQYSFEELKGLFYHIVCHGQGSIIAGHTRLKALSHQQYVNNIISMFNDGEKRFRTNPVFNRVIQSLARGADTYEMLDQLMDIISQQTEHYENALRDASSKLHTFKDPSTGRILHKTVWGPMDSVSRMTDAIENADEIRWNTPLFSKMDISDALIGDGFAVHENGSVNMKFVKKEKDKWMILGDLSEEWVKMFPAQPLQNALGGNTCDLNTIKKFADRYDFQIDYLFSSVTEE